MNTNLMRTLFLSMCLACLGNAVADCPEDEGTLPEPTSVNPTSAIHG